MLKIIYHVHASNVLYPGYFQYQTVVQSYFVTKLKIQVHLQRSLKENLLTKLVFCAFQMKVNVILNMQFIFLQQNLFNKQNSFET